MADLPRHSGLFYHGTKEEVRLGDQIRIKRFLRSPIDAVVCYIPGISPKHKDMEYGDICRWAYRTGDDSIYINCYDPENLQPPKSLSLIARGTGGELLPDEPVEDGQESDE